MRKKIIIGIILILILAIVLLWLVFKIRHADTTGKLQECPQTWIVNKMPTTSKSNLPKQYFVLDGKRRELSEFDLDWVKKNCNLKQQIVQ